MALKARLAEEARLKEEQEHQEELVNQYVETQRIKIRKIFQKSKLIKPIKLHPITGKVGDGNNAQSKQVSIH